jgi:hypothetical protein
MNPDDDGPFAADQPVDETDFGVLGRVRELFEEADPMPGGLPGRIRFALAVHDLETELARVAADDDVPVLAVRGEEHSRTITFESHSLTIMIRVGANPDGTARLDGWLDPPGAWPVEITTTAGPIAVRADEDGRFAASQVPRGRARLTVRPVVTGCESGRSVVTPELIL